MTEQVSTSLAAYSWGGFSRRLQVGNTKAEGDIQELFQQLEEIDDPRQCVARIREQIAKFAAAGIEVPDDLVRTERRFQTECMLESQGR